MGLNKATDLLWYTHCPMGSKWEAWLERLSYHTIYLVWWNVIIRVVCSEFGNTPEVFCFKRDLAACSSRDTDRDRWSNSNTHTHTHAPISQKVFIFFFNCLHAAYLQHHLYVESQCSGRSIGCLATYQTFAWMLCVRCSAPTSFNQAHLNYYFNRIDV